jgi:hypothetical protein
MHTFLVVVDGEDAPGAAPASAAAAAAPDAAAPTPTTPGGSEGASTPPLAPTMSSSQSFTYRRGTTSLGLIIW